MAFIDTVFPDWHSLGSVRRERMAKTAVQSRAGRRQTWTHWSLPQRTFELGFTACSPSDKATLFEFLRGMAVGASSFRFRDWLEYEAGGSLGDDDVFVAGTPVQIGTGDGTATTFQLSIPWTVGGTSFSRKITKPRTGAKIYKAGALQSSGYTLNTTTGVVTFSSAPTSGQVIAWAGLYDVEVEVEGDSVEAVLASMATTEIQSVTLIEVKS